MRLDDRTHQDGVMRSASGYRVVGFTGRGPLPLGWFDLPVEAGVQALYGRNGAGKTTVLNRVRQALALSDRDLAPSTAGYCLEILENPCPFVDVLMESVKTYLPTRIGHWSGDPQILLDRLWHRMDDQIDVALEDVICDILVAELVQDASADPEAVRVCREIAEERVFWIAPGASGRPGWSVWAAASRSIQGVSEIWDLYRLGWPGTDEGAIKMALARTQLAATSPSERFETAFEAFFQPLAESGLDKDKLRQQCASIGEDKLADLFAVNLNVPWPIHFPSLLVSSVGDWMAGTSPDRRSDFPIPLCKVAEFASGQDWVLPELFEPLPDSTFVEDTVTTLRSAATNGRLLEALADEDVIFDSLAAAKLDELVQHANDVYRSLLLDAPRLGCGLLPPEEWASSDAVYWHAFDSGSERSIPIVALSDAQRKWAAFAIAGALRICGEVTEDRSSILVLDEPEQALHVSAVRHLVRGLKSLAGRTGMPIIVATHAAAFLNDPGVMLRQVSRNGSGHAEVKELSAPATETAETLGLTAAEMLQLYRVFLIVEGEHDKAVLETVLGHELDLARSTIIPMRGAKALRSIPDTRLIVDYTDASILIVVDNVKASLVDSFNAMRADVSQGRRRDAIRLIEATLDRRDITTEEQLLCHLFRRAVEVDVLDRIDVVGLSVPDIIELLPVRSFVPNAGSWRELVDEWKSDRVGEPFKAWLRKEKQSNVSITSIRKAAGNLDHVPDDIALIRKRLGEMSFLASN